MKRFLESRVLSLVLLLICAAALALATFIERDHGTAVAREMIYHSALLFVLYLLMIANFIARIIKEGQIMQRRFAMIALHAAFVVILAGALTTHLTGREGIVHLREGERSSSMAVSTWEGQEIVSLPFSIELRDFVLQRYPGSSSPSSYESYITITEGRESREEHISMNNTLDIAGCRLFQTSYDHDEQGSILLVNQDVAGRRITYAGYLLLAIGLLLSFFDGRGRVRSLFRQLSKIKSATLLIIALLSFSNLRAAESIEYLEIAEEHAVTAEHAASFGTLPMQDSHGRIVPINTFASELLRKLHRESSIGKLSPEQFLLSLWLMPDLWINTRFIDSEEGYRSYIDMFDEEENYILEDDLNRIYAKEASQRTTEEREILKLDERVNILNQILSYRMVNILPNERDENHKWHAPGDDLSHFEGDESMFVSRIFQWYLTEVGEAISTGDWSEAERVLNMIRTYQNAKGKDAGLDIKRIETEIRYNNLDPFAKSRTYYLIIGGLIMLISIAELFFDRRRWFKWLKILLWVAALVTFHLHMLGISMRWQIGGYAPWSNSYETMVYIAWVAALVGILFARRNSLVCGIALLLAGIILFVTGLSWLDPQITPLVPVLKSAWLMFHVASIVAAYGMFAISSLLGITNLKLMIFQGREKRERLDRAINELTIINEISMWIGVALLAVGIFLGAIWANESWGRYWGWDPKETWALITLMVYATTTHLYQARSIYSKWLFNFASVAAIFVVVMTYFGVNYLFGGMHSYNDTSLSPTTLIVACCAIGLVVALGVAAKLRTRN